MTRWSLFLAVWVCACGGTNSDRVQGPATVETTAAAQDPSPPADQRPAATAEAPATSTNAPYDVSEEEARRICELKLELDEDMELIRCAFGAGQDLPGRARVDVLELVYLNGARVSAAMLVLRSPEEREFPDTFTVAEAAELAGADEVFTLGTLSVTNGRITLPVESVYTEYPNTGDPDLPSGAIEQRSNFIVQCDATDGFYSCERVER